MIFPPLQVFFAAVGLPKSLSGLCCVLCDSFVPFAKHQQTNLGFPIAPDVDLLPALQYPHTRHNSGVMLLVELQKWQREKLGAYRLR